jgi:outer membrane protein assembly factor BamB
MSALPQNSLVQLSRRQALSAGGGAAAAGLLAVTGCGVTTAARAGTTTVAAGQLIWRAQVAASSDEPVLIAADGLVYAGISAAANGDARTYAINAATGRQAWIATGPRPYAASSGAVFGFAVTRGGATDVVATGAASGRTLWTHDAGPLLDNAKVGWLAYADGLVYAAAGTTENRTAGQPTVRALNARTGRRVWAVTLGAGPQSPVLAGGVLYTPDVTSPVASTGRVVALHASTGARRWTSAALAGAPGLLLVTDGTVCGSTLSASGSAIFALDGATGRQLWQRAAGGLPMAAAGGMVFLMPLSTAKATLSAWHARSGRSAWTRTVPAGAFAVASGSVLYLAGGQTLTAVTATTGTTLWSYRLAADVADVAADGDAVYALDEHGDVYALRT